MALETLLASNKDNHVKMLKVLEQVILQLCYRVCSRAVKANNLREIKYDDGGLVSGLTLPPQSRLDIIRQSGRVAKENMTE